MDAMRWDAQRLDLEDPARVLRRSPEWVLGPQAPYEVTGDVPNVVFPCGFVRDESGETVRIYYGAADTCIAVATATVSDLLDWLRAEPNPLTSRTGIDDLALMGPSTT